MKLTPFLFLFPTIFCINAMDRSQTPPILILRADSPGTQERQRCSERLTTLYTEGLSSSPETIKFLQAQYQCPKKEAAKQEIQKTQERLKTTDETTKRELYITLIRLHMRLMQIGYD